MSHNLKNILNNCWKYFVNNPKGKMFFIEFFDKNNINILELRSNQIDRNLISKLVIKNVCPECECDANDLLRVGTFIIFLKKLYSKYNNIQDFLTEIDKKNVPEILTSLNSFSVANYALEFIVDDLINDKKDEIKERFVSFKDVDMSNMHISYKNTVLNIILKHKLYNFDDILYSLINKPFVISIYMLNNIENKYTHFENALDYLFQNNVNKLHEFIEFVVDSQNDNIIDNDLFYQIKKYINLEAFKDLKDKYNFKRIKRYKDDMLQHKNNFESNNILNGFLA